MSSLNDRLNFNSTETYLGTGKEANTGKKVSHLETYFVRTIPHDRHRFTRFTGYLLNLTESLGDLGFESCKKDCQRQMKYVHGKNVGQSDEFLNLCYSRCNNEFHQIKHGIHELKNAYSKKFGSCLAESKNNQITFEDVLSCKKKIYIQYMENHLDIEREMLASYLEKL